MRRGRARRSSRFRRPARGCWARSTAMCKAAPSPSAFTAVAGYLLPNTLYLADLAANTAEPVKSMPARFDAAKAVVEQFDAVSKDGTAVPYFVVRPRDRVLDGKGAT